MTGAAAIGLEIHVQLKTRSKLFCACPTRFDAEPNAQVCPVCLGHPGVLPVPNREAVRLAVRFALAVGGEVQARSAWARKNYFYPDLPKGYQITQYEEPLVRGGALVIGEQTLRILRMHVEEDAGRSQHPEWVGEETTRIDLNRCGIPLLEIVTAPDLRTPAEAHACLVALRQLLRYCEVSDAEMEKGQLRCDANLSIRAPGAPGLGTPTEVKNLNSFRNVERALTREMERQIALIERGKPIERATMMFDQLTGEVRPMRSKEEEPDYRYFPEPDLPALRIEPEEIERERRRLPELPGARRERLVRAYRLRPADAELLTATRQLADAFEAVAAEVPHIEARQVANLFASDLRAVPGGLEIGSARLAGLLSLLDQGTLSRRQVKPVLQAMAGSDREAAQIVRERGWVQTEDEALLRAWAGEVLDAHPDHVAAYLQGKEGLIRFFMGQLMKRSGGRAHPRKAEKALRDALASRGGAGG